MNSFEINKIAAAILVALLLVKASDLVSEGLVDPEMLEKQAFEIEGVEVKVADGGGADTPVIESIAPLLAAADIENGKKVFKKCTVCHSIDKGGPNKVGPNLYGIVGASVAGVSGFAYSAAMSAHGGNWDYKALNDYLYKPREAVKGTKMAFAGLKKVQDRADVIAYMRQESDSPQPLPVAGVPEPASAPPSTGESEPPETAPSAPSPAEESKPSKTAPSAPSSAGESKPSKAAPSASSPSGESKPSKTGPSDPSPAEESKPSKTAPSAPSLAGESKPSKAAPSASSPSGESKPSKTAPASTGESQPSKTEPSAPAAEPKS